jgi:hypothetical protein
MVPVDLLVNWTSRGALPTVGVAVKAATGAGALAVIVIVLTLVPPGPEAVKVAGYIPATVYVYRGFCRVLVEPSPNDHDQAVTGPPVFVAVN